MYSSSSKTGSGYGFLSPLADSAVDQISVEAAQPRLGLGILRDLADKTIVLGVIDLGTSEIEMRQVVAIRIREARSPIAPKRLVPASDCGMKLLRRNYAYRKLRALVAGTEIIRGESSVS